MMSEEMTKTDAWEKYIGAFSLNKVSCKREERKQKSKGEKKNDRIKDRQEEGKKG